MVKSRQVGKPAKLAASGRKLTRAFADKTPLEDNECMKVCKELCYGLAIFYATFGCDDNHESQFHGFSPHEIRLATDKSAIRTNQVEKEHRARGVLFTPYSVGRSPLLPVSSLMKPQNSIVKKEAKSNMSQTDVTAATTPLASDSLDGTTNKTGSVLHQIKRPLERSSDSINVEPNKRPGRKFVLPVMSVRSSRVIKPNKRFRDVDLYTSGSDVNNGKPVKKIKLVPEAFSDDSSSSWMGKRTDGGLSDADSVSGYWSSSLSTASSSVNDEDLSVRAKGKVVLRKAKLKVGPDPPAVKGPFSSGLDDSIPHEVVCSVCDSVRYYKNIKHARKFGIYSCGTCKKFITKMINSRSKDKLLCNEGKDKCELRPYVLDPVTGERSHNNRCQACWLRMCLRCYGMPESLLARLSHRLPFILEQSTSLLKPKNTETQQVKFRLSYFQSLNSTARAGKPNHNEVVEKQMLAKNIRRKAEAIVRKGRKPKLDLSVTKRQPGVISNKIRNKTKFSNTDINAKRKENSEAKNNGETGVKRKRMREKGKREEKLLRLNKFNLKGPRVKHVCRSASLVLGQPVATFTDTSPSKQKSNSPSKDGRSKDDTNQALPNKQTEKPVETEQGARTKQASESDSLQSGRGKTNLSKQLSSTEIVEENLLDGKARTLQDLSRQHYELINGVTLGKDVDLIAVDFWESYDPEEVCNTGFALIGHGNSFKTKAICFLCGSAGLDQLIHCASCCEPYHRFCVESPAAAEGWAVDWVCSRCIVCHACGKGGGPQVSCQKCHKSHHTDCLAADRLASRLHSADRPWICLSCLCCKSCNNPEVYKFVGNLPLCKVCFKLRQKGNFCPLCQSCYDENDFDSKMMECEQCKRWVHAKCEGLSNEKYQILSLLPDSVEFVCRTCCKTPPAPWWLAVETEMKAGFLAVLKSLSKNRKVCDMLKGSPTKRPLVCHCASAMSKCASRLNEVSEQSDAESADMRVQKEYQSDEPLIVVDQCLKIEPSDTTQSEEILVCDRKTESPIITLGDLRTKYPVRDCSMVMKSSELDLKLDSEPISYQNNDEKPPQFSPHATSQSDSGIGSTDDELKSTNENHCFCLESDNWNNKTPPTLLTIKNKVNSNEYSSIDIFNKDMEEMLNSIKGTVLLKLYYQTLEDAFPWFDPKCSDVVDSTTRVSHKADASKAIVNVIEEKSPDCDIADVSITLKGLLDKSSDYYYNNENKSEDNRLCLLCKRSGEGKPTEEGRLLYCGQNEWVHTNCALWSNEVFEEIDGSLQNVQSAISRSRHIRCFKCNKKGASVGCCNRSCPEAFHFGCARNNNCIFFEDKSLYCSNHKKDTNLSRELVTGSDFLVSRPVYVELDTKKKRYIAKHNINIMIGSLTITSLGEFSSDLSDQECSIIPYNFQCSRLFWSSVEPWRLVQYNIRTKIIYTVSDESIDNDNNFTIYHSPDQSIKSEAEMICVEETKPDQNDNLLYDIKEVLENVLDIVCVKDEEETQASADLLPPELKEAIFEDLPHDLLDGISMQDIFPKLMSFDPSVLDMKPEKEIKNSPSKLKSSKVKNKIEFDPVSKIKQRGRCNDLLKKGTSKQTFSFSRKNKICDEDVKRVTQVEEKENSKDWGTARIIQLDGTGDCSSEESEVGSPTSEEPFLIHDSQSFQNHTIRKCRILQVDGVVDSCTSSSGSECGSPSRSVWKLGQVDGAMDLDEEIIEDNPVKCTRCHRTYRTAQSFERHLQTCNVDYILSCSESDSSEEDKTSNSEIKLSEAEDLATTNNESAISQSDEVINSPPVENNKLSLISPELINNLEQSTQISNLRTYRNNKNKPNDVPDNNITTLHEYNLSSDCIQKSSISESSIITTNTMSFVQNSKPKTIRAMYECVDAQITPLSSTLVNMIPKRNFPVRTYGRKKKPALQSTALTTIKTYQNEPTIEYQPAPSGPPSVIIQQMPSYIESIPQPPPNNIQYQYITTVGVPDKQQIPLTIQLQPPISIQPVLPTVVGTLIQPNGIEQLVVNTPAPTVDMLNQQPANVYITNVNQPMYMGMETVVSNTIMSSSQFVSGVLSGSSYSATTTQVYQAAKPVIDLPQSYVVVNTQTNPISEPAHAVYPTSTTTQPWCYNYQETYKVKETTTYQQVTRHLIQDGSNINCLQIGNTSQPSVYLNKPIVKEVTVEKTHSIKKTGHIPPNIPNMINNGNTLLIDNEGDRDIYVKKELRSVLPVMDCTGPKVEGAVQSNAKELSTNIVQCSNKDDGEELKTNIMNQKTEHKMEIAKRVFIIPNNSQVSTNEKYNRPVITKVKANPNSKNNIHVNLNVKTISSDNKGTASLGELLLINKVPSPKEISMAKTHPDINTSKLFNNNVKKDFEIKLEKDVMKPEKRKNIEVKRAPLKENKTVTNKVKNNNNHNRKVKSVKSVSKSNPKLVYEISSQDGISICSHDLKEAWQKVFDAVQSARAAKGLPPLSQNPSLSHLRTLGLDNNRVKYLIEQLPGAVNCTNYKPTYHKNKLFGHSDQLPENPTGCARTEAYSNVRRKYDMFSWLASRHRQPPKLIVNSDTEIVNGISRRATSLNLPMAMRFRHLKETSKESVGVFRSDIHGRGLFCLRDIDSGEMVIEYAGEVIRAGLTDKREHYYTSKGIGCYMFRIDDHFVVDATMHGNAARFINHSCEPNCYSRVVDILGKKHILIFALRKIPQGEELTYDYKFPLEDDKITCHCLSRKCRKYLN